MDKVVRAIEQGLINHENISFDILRSKFGFNHDIWDQLGRGRNILNSEEQLDQYLYSYGPMVKSHLDNALEGIKPIGEKFLVADYGCGQGLASLRLREKIDDLTHQNVTDLVLIEPSVKAIDRACAVVKCCYPSASLRAVRKRLDELNSNDLKFGDCVTKIHLFSNILDVDGFDIASLFNSIFQNKGRHVIVAVSHDRNHNGGSDRIEGIFFKIMARHEKFVFREICLRRFKYKDRQDAIFFRLDMEFPHGSV